MPLDVSIDMSTVSSGEVHIAGNIAGNIER
jgi:hypothetical protein